MFIYRHIRTGIKVSVAGYHFESLFLRWYKVVSTLYMYVVANPPWLSNFMEGLRQQLVVDAEWLSCATQGYSEINAEKSVYDLFVQTQEPPWAREVLQNCHFPSCQSVVASNSKSQYPQIIYKTKETTVKARFPAGTWRRGNVDGTSWRCIDADATLHKRHVPSGSWHNFK